MTESEQLPSVTLRQVRDYQFDIAFEDGMAHWVADEGPPLGHGAGPSPTHLLLAAVGDCMSSSLHFALTKFKNTPGGMTTLARAHLGRNEAGRLRVLRIEVEMHLAAAADQLLHLDRVLGQFEDFCTVGASVRAGIPMDVSVFDGRDVKLK